MQGVFCVVLFLALCFPIKAGFKPSLSLSGLKPASLSAGLLFPGSQPLVSPPSGGTNLQVQSAPAVVNPPSSGPGSSIFSGAAPVNPRSKVTTFFEVADDAFWSSNWKYIKLTQDDDKDKQTCQDKCEENSSCALAIICNATEPTTPTNMPQISIPELGQSLGLTLNIGRSSYSDKHTCIWFRESSQEIQLDETEKNSWGDECMYLVINPICREASSEKGWEKHGNPRVGPDQIVTQPYKCKSGYNNGKEGPPRTTCDADGVFGSTGGCELVLESELTPPFGSGNALDTSSNGIVQPVLSQPLLNFPFPIRTDAQPAAAPTTDPVATDPPTTNPTATDQPTTAAQTTPAQTPAIDPTTTNPTATDQPTTAAQTTPAQTPAIHPSATNPPVTDPPTTNPTATDQPITAAQTTPAQTPAIDPTTTNPPVTDPPTTNPPATAQPTTNPPVTDPPTTVAPTTTAPVIERPQDCPSSFIFDPKTYLCFVVSSTKTMFYYSDCEAMYSESRLAILNTMEKLEAVGAVLAILRAYGINEPMWVDAEQFSNYLYFSNIYYKGWKIYYDSYNAEETQWGDGTTASRDLFPVAPTDSWHECIQINENGHLEEADCYHKKYFVCEVPIPHCPDNFKYDEKSHFCFRLEIEKEVTKTAAEMNCINEGGRLGFVSSFDRLQALEAERMNRGVPLSTGIWVGAKELESRIRYYYFDWQSQDLYLVYREVNEWNDHSPIGIDLWSEWNPDDEECVKVAYGELTSAHCDDIYAYICEIEQ